MPPVRVQTINGITYPREVPVPDGLPEGWKAVEQAYGPNSKAAGMTYVRYTSLDGKHKNLLGPKQVVQAHCEQLGIPWEPEYAKYQDAFNARKEREAHERAKERAARGQLDGEKREEAIALSRERFGELTGPIVLGFPGWKCRWDFLPDSEQTPKTFLAPDGREWKLLKDLECMLGSKLEGGSTAEIEEITAMVEAGKKNTDAHDLFSMGSTRARETRGSCLIDPEVGGEAKAETAEERKERVKATKKRRKIVPGGKDNLHSFTPVVHPPQEGWAALATMEDRKQGFTEFQDRLLKRKFPDTTEILAVYDVKEASRFAARISGMYYQMTTAVSGRRCYQKLMSSSKYPAGFGCDGVYILWNATESRWQFSTRPLEEAACIAHCTDDQEEVTAVSKPWQIQLQGIGDFQEDDSLKVIMASTC
mmetsp:Transcript_108505/g.203707  ORF Transcript_108505/g.203707 Transcript_108505/m.203707 type:complete len:421 (+) Transcript_108505:42-1304(+)